MKKLFLIFILFVVVGCTKRNLPSEETGKPGDVETVASPIPDQSMKDRYSMSGSNVSASPGDSSIGGTLSETIFVVPDISGDADAGADAGADEAPPFVTGVEEFIPDHSTVVLMPEEVFDFCTFPESLKLSVQKTIDKDDCHFITEEDLSQIKKLTITNMREEETSLLNKEYVSYFPVLEDLNMSKNLWLSFVPSFVTHLRSLKKLNISQTGISDFGGDICRLEKLEVLMASHNNYVGQEIPIEIFCLSSLKVLDMSHSSIRYIDEYIYKLENLEEFYMNSNKLMVLPFMLHKMPNLLVVDLTDNVFEPLSEVASMVEYTPLNTLHTCKETGSNSNDRKSCQESMLDNLKCSWWYKLPFERGRSFRLYKDFEDMTVRERDTFERLKPEPTKNRCYNFWLNTVYVPLPDEEKSEFMERTINGKTIREWKIVFSLMEEQSIWHKFGFTSVCEIIRLYSDTTHLPNNKEIFPERYFLEDWDTPPREECSAKEED